jgi:hypothetical protein
MAHLSGSPPPNQIVTASRKHPESWARSFGISVLQSLVDLFDPCQFECGPFFLI